MPKLADVCADDAEVLALSCVRLIAAGYATGDVACWDLAHTGVERVLGAEGAGPLVAGLTTLVRALRSERRAEWRFLPATCCRVTQDEEHLVRLMAAARADDPKAAARAAVDLTGNPASPQLEMAMRITARALEDTAQLLRFTPPARPRFH